MLNDANPVSGTPAVEQSRGQSTRQLALLGGVFLFAVLVKIYISTVMRSSLYGRERYGWAWLVYFGAFACLAVVPAGLAAFLGKKLNRATAVLLGAIGGGLATAIYQPILGAAVGLVVGAVVALGLTQPVGLALSKLLAAVCVGTLGGTIAFGSFDAPDELLVVPALIISSIGALAVAVLFLPLTNRSTVGLSSRLRTIVLRVSLFLAISLGLWLGISVDTVRRVKSLTGGVDLAPGPLGVTWLWQGLFDVQQLWLRSEVTDANLDKLRRFTNLTGLTIHNSSRVTDAGLEHLQGLTALNYLNLHHVPISDVGLSHFRRVNGLRYVDLMGTQVTGTGLRHLGPGVLRLGLSESAVTDDGLIQLQPMTGLVWLDLAKTQITDAGLIHLRALTSLRSLELRNTRITDRGLLQLSGLSSLVGLGLSGTEVTDSGLTNLRGLPKLQHLDLSNTAISDHGLPNLTACAALTDLDLRRTNVSVAGVAELKKLSPNLHIVFPGGDELE